mmetsp:Transcript_42233/g.82629  ORF Transcript_42233/g.82629 Transcript_42233/m.82629 type:complete len:265 (+) Transcript_42233:198-992(+)
MPRFTSGEECQENCLKCKNPRSHHHSHSKWWDGDIERHCPGNKKPGSGGQNLASAKAAAMAASAPSVLRSAFARNQSSQSLLEGGSSSLSATGELPLSKSNPLLPREFRGDRKFLPGAAKVGGREEMFDWGAEHLKIKTAEEGKKFVEDLSFDITEFVARVAESTVMNQGLKQKFLGCFSQDLTLFTYPSMTPAHIEQYPHDLKFINFLLQGSTVSIMDLGLVLGGIGVKCVKCGGDTEKTGLCHRRGRLPVQIFKGAEPGALP